MAIPLLPKLGCLLGSSSNDQCNSKVVDRRNTQTSVTDYCRRRLNPYVRHFSEYSAVVMINENSSGSFLSWLLYSCLFFQLLSTGLANVGPPPNVVTTVNTPLLLPNTSAINGELTANLSVNKFFSLWIVFNNEPVLISEKPFTILAPVNNASTAITEDRIQSYPELVRKFILDHIVLGQKLDLNIPADFSFTTLGGKTVNIRRHNGVLHANGAKIVTEKVDVGTGRLVITDNYLFPEDLTQDHSFLQDMTEILSFLQSGVRVFQHLLVRTNVTKLLNQGDTYTVLVPTDKAFQKWHPIDWGFYPFAVPEFTEHILTNHFLKGTIRQQSIIDKKTYVTLGGLDITFERKDGVLLANEVEMIKGDTPVLRGNIMFITEVLFMNDSIVQELHEHNHDKETPPLIALPWFDSQFLSHAYLALENIPHFKHITRFLRSTNVAAYILGHGYTFFVPTDEAIVEQGLDKVSNFYMASEKQFKVLLSHFIKTRLYSQDLHNNTILTTVANTTLKVYRDEDNNIFIDNAKIIRKEIYVYNLGNMFCIDRILHAELLPPTTSSETSFNGSMQLALEGATVTTNPYSETIPNELFEETGSFPDTLLEQDSSNTSLSI